MATLAELPIPQIKTLLRQCDIEPVRILEAKTKPQLLELAESFGLVEVPDVWTMDRIRQEQLRRKEIALAKLTVAGLAAERAIDEQQTTDAGTTAPLLEIIGASASPRVMISKRGGATRKRDGEKATRAAKGKSEEMVEAPPSARQRRKKGGKPGKRGGSASSPAKAVADRRRPAETVDGSEGGAATSAVEEGGRAQGEEASQSSTASTTKSGRATKAGPTKSSKGGRQFLTLSPAMEPSVAPIPAPIPAPITTAVPAPAGRPAAGVAWDAPGPEETAMQQGRARVGRVAGGPAVDLSNEGTREPLPSPPPPAVAATVAATAHVASAVQFADRPSTMEPVRAASEASGGVPSRTTLEARQRQQKRAPIKARPRSPSPTVDERTIDDGHGERGELSSLIHEHDLPSLAELRNALVCGRNRPTVTPRVDKLGRKAAQGANGFAALTAQRSDEDSAQIRQAHMAPEEKEEPPKTKLEAMLFSSL